LYEAFDSLPLRFFELPSIPCKLVTRSSIIKMTSAYYITLSKRFFGNR
jgi:hypothetical protein